MKDDYVFDILKDYVVDKCVDLMHNNEDFHCIYLTDQAVIAEKKCKNLYEVALKQKYSISFPAALWRNDF